MASITTRAGKGSPLTNAELDANFTNLNTELLGKQDTLVSGTNIKTVNGQSVLGSGNIQIDAGVSSFNTRTGAVTLSSSDVTTALGFTPYNSTNPSGYITSSALTPYLTSATAASTYQPLDSDLTSIAGLAGTTGLLRKTAANTWTLDTATYLTGNQTITVSGDATGSGATSIALTLANSGVTAGTYRSVTVDAKGRVTAGTNPTTLSGYGITDAQPLDADLTAIAALTGTSGFLKTDGAGTWSVDTSTYLTSATASSTYLPLAGGALTGNLAVSTTLAAWGVNYKALQVGTTSALVDGSGFTTLHSNWWLNGGGQPIYLTTRGASSYQQYNGDHKWYSAPSGTAGTFVSFDAARMTLSAAGDLNAVGAITQNGSQVLHAGNYTSYSPSLTGSGASGTWGISVTGSAATLTTGRTIGMTGDVTWTSASFNGSANVTGTATLANSGVTAGTYTKVTVDAKGRVTVGASLASADLPTYTGTLTSSQITTGLGFTPGTGDVTLTGTQTLTNKTVSGGIYSGVVDQTGSVRGGVVAMAALDVDCSAGNYFTKTISANSTFTFSNAPASRSYGFVLEVTHTSGTLTWPAAVRWPANTAPTLTSGKTHLFVFVTDDGGTTWRGASSVDYNN